jgi:type IV pilus assembly protein PilN
MHLQWLFVLVLHCENSPMITFNLLPWRENLQTKKNQDFKKKILGAIFFAIAIIVLWHLFLTHKNKLEIKKQYLLNASLIKIKQNYSKMEMQQKYLLQLESFSAEIKNLDSKAQNNGMMFNEISKIMPAKMYLTQLNTNNEIIILSGKTLSLENVSILMQNIAKTKTFKTPELQEIKNDPYDNTLKNFTFTMNKNL